MFKQLRAAGDSGRSLPPFSSRILFVLHKYDERTRAFGTIFQYSKDRSDVMADLLCMGIDIRERLLHAALSLGYDRTAHHLSR
jgi:hypothetical protein